MTTAAAVGHEPRARLDLSLALRIEAHAQLAWPPSACERAPGGWTLRATPGLERGRSNSAIPPRPPLAGGQIAEGIALTEAFAARHGIVPAIQVSPLEAHGALFAELRARGWSAGNPVLVMVADVAPVSEGGRGLELAVSDHADARWLDAWAACDPRRDVESHRQTVFAALAGHAVFARHGRDAVGIAVASGGLAGLFCLAVSPAVRRQGVGSALVRGLLERSGAEQIAYLQVQEENRPAVALYERLGFRIAYRYRHCRRDPAVRSRR